MDRARATGLIRDLFSNTCFEMFESFNCEVQSLSDVDFDSAHVPTARIDAGTKDFEITLTLQLPFSVLAMIYPIQTGIARVDDGELEDWICELSNQMLGKLNAALITHGCTLSQGLPIYSYDQAELEPLPENSVLSVYHFDIDHEICETSIAIEIFEEELSINEEAAIDPNHVNDGDIEFF